MDLSITSPSLLLVVTFLAAGCASQKTQTTEHPPASSPLSILAEGQTDFSIDELDATSGERETEVLASTNEESILIAGLPGIAGEPGVSEETRPDSELPVFLAGNQEALPTPNLLEDFLGSESRMNLPGETSASHPALPVAPPEDLDETEFPGPTGEAGISDNLLAEKPNDLADDPNDSSSRDLSLDNLLPSLDSEDGSDETPPGISGALPVFPTIPQGEEPEGEVTQGRPDFGWPWQSNGEDGEGLDGTTYASPREDLLTWLNDRKPARPDDSDGLLDDFAKPGDALAWLLGRAVPGSHSGGPDDTLKQAAVLAWLVQLRNQGSTGPDVPALGKDLANALDWFRKGGAGDGNEAPDQSDLTGATRQLARWLGHAAQKDADEEGPKGLHGAGSSAMQQWLSQGRQNQRFADPDTATRQALQFPFHRPSTGQPKGEALAEQPDPSGAFSFPTLPGYEISRQLPRSRQLKGKAHQWLQFGADGVQGAWAIQGAGFQRESVNYSAAYSWLRQAASSWKQKASPASRVANTPLRPRPDLATQENASEALRWFRKGSGQRRHWLHATRERESGTDSVPTP